MILNGTLGGDGGQGELLGGVAGCGTGGAAFGEDVQADVAAHLGPLVVLFGQDRAHEANETGAGGRRCCSARLRW